MIAKAAPWKHGTISKLSEDISRGGTLAIIDIHGIPADAMLGCLLYTSDAADE